MSAEKIDTIIGKYRANKKYEQTPWQQIAAELVHAGMAAASVLSKIKTEFPGIRLELVAFEDYCSLYHVGGMPKTDAVHLAAQRFPELFADWKKRLARGDKHLKELFPRR